MLVSGTFIADNAIAANIDIGFIPDYIEAIDLTTTLKIYRWHRVLYEKSGNTYAGFMYGSTDDGAGALSPSASAAYGFSPYDEGEALRVLIEHPSTGVDTAKAVTGDWTTARATGASARGTTSIGTIIRPTTHNGYVYECTTAMTTGGATEPTWGTVVGGTTADGTGSAGRWMCREENLTKRGGMGFTVGASISTDSDVWAFKAERHDRVGDMGDSADYDPISFPKEGT